MICVPRSEVPSEKDLPTRSDLNQMIRDLRSYLNNDSQTNVSDHDFGACISINTFANQLRNPNLNQKIHESAPKDPIKWFSIRVLH